MPRRLAWGWTAWILLCVVLDTWFTAESAPLMSETAWAKHGWPLISVATLGSTLMGALVVSRRPRQPLGWLLMVVSISMVGQTAESFSVWVLDHGGPGSGAVGHLAAWLSALLNAPIALTAVVLIYLIAPDGHLASRRWRWVAALALAGLALYLGAVALLSPATYSLDTSLDDTDPLAAWLNGLGLSTIAVAILLALVGLVLRLRRATGEVRRQLLWIATSAALLTFGLSVLFAVVGTNGGTQTWLAATPLFLSYAALPVCVAIAVLRHRLLEIDLIVNRALVVIVATALVTAAYVLVVVTLGPAVGNGSGWRALLATAVVALAFQPVRRRVVRLADRVAYGQAAAPYDALSDFSRRLADSPDPSELLPAVAEAAATAVAAQRATAALHVPGAPDLVASTSEAASGTGAAALELTVGDEDGELGVLSVEMPPGRGLRPRDAALLRDLADQTVVAFRNARLAAELSRDLEQLARRTEALAESRRRLITAGDAERDRLERAIAREVVPHLAAVPDRLEQLASSGADGVRSAALQPLLAEVAAALEALREITRGVYPAQLVRSGLEPALRSLLARTATPAVSVEALPSREQLGPAAEGAAYFCVAEAARDLVLLEAVRLVGEPGALALRVEGRGDPDALPLANMRDRVEAAGGALQALSTADRVVVDVRLPLGGAAGDQAADAAQAALSVSGASSDLVT